MYIYINIKLYTTDVLLWRVFHAITIQFNAHAEDHHIDINSNRRIVLPIDGNWEKQTASRRISVCCAYTSYNSVLAVKQSAVR